RLRTTLPALRCLSKDKMDVVSFEDDLVLAVRRWTGTSEVISIFNFNDRKAHQFRGLPCGVWQKRLDSSDTRWMGDGVTAPEKIEPAIHGGGLFLQPHGVLLYEKENLD